ncbi:MAG: phospholipid/cholesterol/gamma-HCH transport system ATP-binding protein [Pseudoalteromonas tetraodonis]|jgi:phospholipid/cholesterol/gamma-HCH transport system ATP-binding protein
MGKTQNFIEFVDVHKKIREQPILRGVNFGVGEGETLVVLGYSGAGKSVMLRHILGLMKPDAGKILVDGVDVASLPEKKLAPTRKKVGMLFQNGALFDSMDVAGNVAFPLRERGEDNPKVLDQKVLHSLELVGLEDHLEKMPVELSGGMKKRIALARAIVTEPRCILYDEPTAGLDPVAADSIDHLIRRLKQRLGVTSVVVTHDMKSARHIADHVAMLRDGEIYFYGTPDELMASEDPVLQDFVEGRSGETS